MIPVDVSFVIPFRNEERFLSACCESLARQEMGGLRAEVLLVDGESTDGSAAVVAAFVAQSDDRITFRLLRNPEVRTPFGFNVGISAASAAVVGLGGAHTIYPPHYLRTAVELLGSSGAGVVGGGHTRFIPSAAGLLGEAMASLYQSPMGAGVAAYHRRTTAGFVDTVYGGFYKREVFDRVGTFNLSLPKNQDNELNARVTAAGYKILFDPRLSTEYVLKTDVQTFFGRAYRFGFFHPTTWRNSASSFRVRHAVPAALVLYLLAIPFTGPSHPWVLVPLALYLLLLIAAALRLTRIRPVGAALLTVPLFLGYHMAYGLGTLRGALTLPIERPTSHAPTVQSAPHP